jgi:hypothetical protein
MKSSTGVSLCRILPQKYLDNFLTGKLYMNTSRFFGEIEADQLLRHDPSDGIAASFQVSTVAIKLMEATEYTPIGGIINPMTVRQRSLDHSNILCLHMIRDDPSYFFDARNLEFGDVAVHIVQPKVFLSRMRSAAEKNGRHLYVGHVDYVPRSTHHGPMGLFRKFDSYDYQSEFRCAVSPGNGEAFTLKIGDIRDIVLVKPSAEIPIAIQQLKNKSSSSLRL